MFLVFIKSLLGGVAAPPRITVASRHWKQDSWCWVCVRVFHFAQKKNKTSVIRNFFIYDNKSLYLINEIVEWNRFFTRKSVVLKMSINIFFCDSFDAVRHLLKHAFKLALSCVIFLWKRCSWIATVAPVWYLLVKCTWCSITNRFFPENYEPFCKHHVNVTLVNSWTNSCSDDVPDFRPAVDTGGDRPSLKLTKSKFIHHDFVQFGKQHSRYKVIWSCIVLSQERCVAYIISLTVAQPSWELTNKCYWNRLP